MTEVTLSPALTPEQVAACVRSLPVPLKLSEADIGHRIQFLMSLWKLRKSVPEPDRAPSTRAQDLGRLKRKLERARDGMLDFFSDAEWHEELKSASESLLNRQGIHPPNVDAQRIELRPVDGQKKRAFIQHWSVEDAFSQAHATMAWLCDVVSQAEVTAKAYTKDNGGSPDPDQVDHDTVRHLAALYFGATGIQAKQAGHNPEEDERKGWFLGLVENAFGPLDGRSRDAYSGLIQRALSP